MLPLAYIHVEPQSLLILLLPLCCCLLLLGDDIITPLTDTADYAIIHTLRLLDVDTHGHTYMIRRLRCYHVD